MKNIVTGSWLMALAGFLTIIAILPASAQSSRPKFDLTKIADDVYSFRFFIHRNMIFVTDEGVIISDPMNPAAAKLMMVAIKRLTDKPVKYVIYTHNHWDHISGAAIFKQQGAKIVQHQLGANGTRPNPHVVPADTTWSGDRHDITLGDQTVELHYLGPSHGLGMTVIRLPRQKLLHTVDTVTPKRVMFMNMPDYIPYRLIEALEKIETMDFERIIPGHGAAEAPRSAVTEAREYLQDLSVAIDNAVKITKNPFAFSKITELVKHELKPKYGKWGGFEGWLEMNIIRITQEKRMGWN